MSESPRDTVDRRALPRAAQIGSGGMADVYCAEDTHLGRKIAMKLLHARFAQDQRVRRALPPRGLVRGRPAAPERRRRLRPGRVRRHLLHRDGVLRGRDAQGRDPRARRRSTRARAIAITKQILVAARFAHRRNVIHRDLKPHNVILDAEDNVKVTDFGIARAGASDITEVGRDHGHRAVPLARAGAGPAGDGGLGPLLDRRRAVRDADRPARRSRATARSRSRSST